MPCCLGGPVDQGPYSSQLFEEGTVAWLKAAYEPLPAAVACTPAPSFSGSPQHQLPSVRSKMSRFSAQVRRLLAVGTRVGTAGVVGPPEDNAVDLEQDPLAG